jgi:hypothetical protein
MSTILESPRYTTRYKAAVPQHIPVDRSVSMALRESIRVLSRSQHAEDATVKDLCIKALREHTEAADRRKAAIRKQQAQQAKEAKARESIGD